MIACTYLQYGHDSQEERTKRYLGTGITCLCIKDPLPLMSIEHLKLEGTHRHENTLPRGFGFVPQRTLIQWTDALHPPR